MDKTTKEQVEEAFSLVGERITRLSVSSLLFLALAACLYGAGWSKLAFICLFLTLLQGLNRIAFFFDSPLSRFIHWIHALTFELLGILAVFVTFPIRYFWNDQKVSASGNGKPILLVHGYLNNGSVWFIQKRWLEAAGLGPIYTINLWHPFCSLHQYAKQVHQKAEQIAKDTKQKELILIGHSMGGLVSCLYAIQQAPPQTVTDVITIGSPLAGTHMALLALGANAKEMRRESEIVKQVQTAIPHCTSTRFYHVATKVDQLIIPFQSALIGDRSEHQFILEDVGHVGLVYSKRVARCICHWLRKAQADEKFSGSMPDPLRSKSVAKDPSDQS